MPDIHACYNEASKVATTDPERALQILAPLLEVQQTNKEAADSLVKFARKHDLPHEQGRNILYAVFEAYKEDLDIVTHIGMSLEAARDIDDLNAASPDHPLFAGVIQSLVTLSNNEHDTESEADLAEALSSAARLSGRAYDDFAEKSHSRLTELLTETSWPYYNQGLFFKTRGRFEEGVLANQKALELSDEEDEAHMWNLGICATGAGKGDIALDVWKRIGCTIELGRFGLPEGGFPSCKVKLAQYPLAERSADNDHPGLEETVWIERLSPCHGIIRSVLYQGIGVDYGDIILFDGAPITFHTYGENKYAVFPHLYTLIRSNYHFYDFAATQQETGEIHKLDQAFVEDLVIYSHTENYKVLCSACWRNQDLDHAEHKDTEEKHVVTGRIAAPPDLSPEAVLNRIDEALADNPHNQIYAPSLCQAAGLQNRMIDEKRRYRLLMSQ